MRPGDQPLADRIIERLQSFDQNCLPLPGITSPEYRDCLIRQIVDSTRRIKYANTIRDRRVTSHCADPASIAFDPIKGASWHRANGNIDEAFWLIFLSTHFGKNAKHKWNLMKGVYGALEDSSLVWTWDRISGNFNEFIQWYQDNNETLKQVGAFSSHRKYQSRKANVDGGTIATFSSYIDWVGPTRSHLGKIQSVVDEGNDDPKTLFRTLYNSMIKGDNKIFGFARLGIFDFLTMVGKLELVEIEPDSTYLRGSTGPIPGARLLLTGDQNSTISIREMEDDLSRLEQHLGLYFGMQVLEDALCNWQKNPGEFNHFKG